MTEVPDVSEDLLRHFSYDHLPLKPVDLQNVSRMCAELALHMFHTLPAGSEKTAGMRKLLEAKDCFVRSMQTTSIPE